MTYLEAEKNLVLFLAGALELAPDREIFAGTPPDGVIEAMTVDLKEGYPASVNRTNTFTVRTGGKYLCRQICRQNAFSVTSLLPAYGKSSLISVILDEKAPLKFFTEEQNDEKIHCFTLDLIVTFA